MPDDLAEFLREREYAMLLQGSDHSTVFVVRVPGREIASIAGRVPMKVTHEFYQHQLAPVIRTTVRIIDQPDRPLKLETFTNVREEEQWRDYASLPEQEHFSFLFYDEDLSHRLSKQMQNGAGEDMQNILNWVDRIARSIPQEHYDFN